MGVPAVAERILAVRPAPGFTGIDGQVIHHDAVDPHAFAVLDFDQLFDSRFAESRIIQSIDIGMQERVLGLVADEVFVPARVNDDP